MRFRTFLAIAAILAASASARPADAAIIGLFNFNDAGASGTNSASNTMALFSVDQGVGALSSNFAAANIVDFNGTVTNAQGSDGAGVALALQGGTGNANNGGFLQYNGSTVGFNTVGVSFAIQATGTGFNSNQFEYSTDGTNFINLGSAFAPVASFGTTTAVPGSIVSFDLSSLAGVSNDATFAFRIVFNGATSSSGNNRIDNLLISGTALTTAAVPEPASLALLGLGLVGVVAARRRNRA